MVTNYCDKEVLAEIRSKLQIEMESREWTLNDLADAAGWPRASAARVAGLGRSGNITKEEVTTLSATFDVPFEHWFASPAQVELDVYAANGMYRLLRFLDDLKPRDVGTIAKVRFAKDRGLITLRVENVENRREYPEG